MITANNLKYYVSLKQKKYRNLEKKFLIEGFHLLEECLSSEFVIDVIILRNDIDLKHHAKLETLINSKQITVEYIPENSFNKLSETESSQGIIAVVIIPALKNESHANGSLIIALDRINDPGNLGTILRTAYWFGVDRILVSNNSADIYNSKVLRASQGAVFYVNISSDVNLEKELSFLSSEGFKIFLLTLDAEKSIGSVKNPAKAVYVFGNESDGILESLKLASYQKLKIGGNSECESLNVAVSAGIVLHSVKSSTKK